MTRKHPPLGGPPVNPPIERASTLLLPTAADVYRSDVVTYGRHGVRVHQALKDAFCALEGGAACALAPSGLNAIATGLMAFAGAGDHVLVTDSAYAPTRRIATDTLPRFGVEAEFYDPRAGAEIADRLKPNTKAILLESPGSLTFEIQDVPAIAKAAQAKNVVTLIDNTWSAGLALKPLALGVDVALHSATKYPSGGSDVFLGAMVARSEALGVKLAAHVRNTGVAVSPDDAYLVLRSMRSLEARFQAQSTTARTLADWLAARPHVARVLHPALESHPDHALWTRDFTGAASVFGVVLKPAETAQVNAFLDALTVFGLGFSYGGFESLALHCDPQLKRDVVPWSAEGPLLRFAVGLEPLDDLIADLERGFEALS